MFGFAERGHFSGGEVVLPGMLSFSPGVETARARLRLFCGRGAGSGLSRQGFVCGLASGWFRLKVCGLVSVTKGSAVCSGMFRVDPFRLSSGSQGVLSDCDSSGGAVWF